jgi:LytS/YehU family sensor histidine kinase
MNAINSIILSISDKEKEEARTQLLHFSRLHRSLLLSSDKIHRSLADEVEFTQNYLALEKFRFRDKFEYRFDIDPAIDQEVPVPKMILQIHVENAVKHGLFHLEKKGLLNVTIFMKGNNLILQVTDNGVGRKYAGDHGAETTGKGLAVMKQYAELFNKYHPGKISTAIEDLIDNSGNPEGTRVRITLSLGDKE